jgi:hypothetical protein
VHQPSPDKTIYLCLELAAHQKDRDNLKTGTRFHGAMVRQ